MGRKIDADLTYRETDEGRNRMITKEILTPDSRDNSENTAGLARLFKPESSNQLPSKLGETKIDLNSHILRAIHAVITKKEIPQLQNGIEELKNSQYAKKTYVQGPFDESRNGTRPQNTPKSTLIKLQ